MIPSDISPDTARRMFRGKMANCFGWAYGYYDEMPLKHGTRSMIYESVEGEGGFPFRTENEVIRETVGQCTGLVDRCGEWIWEGDVLEERSVIWPQTTHYGDAYPEGGYTEYYEPKIATRTLGPVTWDEFGWTVDKNPFFPVLVVAEAKDVFEYSPRPDDWNSDDDSDLPYLLDKYGYASEDDLLLSLGCAVIGNIHDNPQLLEGWA